MATERRGSGSISALLTSLDAESLSVLLKFFMHGFMALADEELARVKEVRERLRALRRWYS